jgi:hypothetical protein
MKKSKLYLKKVTILSLDDAQLLRGGDDIDSKDGYDSYCGGCETQQQEQSGCCCTNDNTGCPTPTYTPTCELCPTDFAPCQSQAC